MTRRPDKPEPTAYANQTRPLAPIDDASAPSRPRRALRKLLAPWHPTHRAELQSATGHMRVLELRLVDDLLHDAAGIAWFTRHGTGWLYRRAAASPLSHWHIRALPGPRPVRGEPSKTRTLRLTDADVAAFDRAAKGEGWRAWLAQVGRKAAGIE